MCGGCVYLFTSGQKSRGDYPTNKFQDGQQEGDESVRSQDLQSTSLGDHLPDCCNTICNGHGNLPAAVVAALECSHSGGLDLRSDDVQGRNFKTVVLLKQKTWKGLCCRMCCIELENRRILLLHKVMFGGKNRCM